MTKMFNYVYSRISLVCGCGCGVDVNVNFIYLLILYYINVSFVNSNAVFPLVRIFSNVHKSIKRGLLV